LNIQIPEPVLVELDKLKTDQENPNRMSPRQLEALEESFRRYGFIIPIVTNKHFLIADGEQRLSIARKLGMTQVPVVRLDVSDVDRRILRQVLNKLRGQHKEELDAKEYHRIVEEGEREALKRLTALSDFEIQRHINMLIEPKPLPPILPLKDVSVKRGDIYELGNHRLMCGDSLNHKDVESLLDGLDAELFFLDPPYGMELLDVFDFYLECCNTLLVMNSDRESAKYAELSPFFRYFLVGQRRFSRTPNIRFPLLHHTLIGVYQRELKFNQLQPPFSSIIPYFVKPGTFEKNPYFMERVLYAYTERSDVVAGLFAGKGNMLLTCERAGRRCFAMDLNPECCQMILDRWEAYTTLKPRKLNGDEART
jgi:hypothetical protein